MKKKPPQPTNELAKYYSKWEEKYDIQEKALNEIFNKTHPNNKKLKDIIVKVTLLNDFYSTSIFDTFSIAKGISKIRDLDKRLKKGDLSLINDICECVDRKNYSFATKYCSFHNPEKFAIYDRYVLNVLCYFQQKDKFSNEKITKKKLENYKNYEILIKSINEFKKYYKLKGNLKTLDKFIWDFGKDAKYDFRINKK